MRDSQQHFELPLVWNSLNKSIAKTINAQIISNVSFVFAVYSINQIFNVSVLLKQIVTT